MLTQNKAMKLKGLLLALCLLFSLVGVAQADGGPWEYKVLRYQIQGMTKSAQEMFEETFNAEGETGWELVTIEMSSGQAMAFFKRRK